MVEKNKKAKIIVLLLGIAFLLGGIICFVIDFVDFFQSLSNLNDIQKPTKFYMCFIGAPLAIVGLIMIQISSLSGMFKKVRNHSINQQVAYTEQIICPKCSEVNSKDARYCDKCGNSLFVTCPYCSEENRASAEYCKNCGKKLC